MKSPMQVRRWISTDLAPGDLGANRLDLAGLTLRAIGSVDDPAFTPAYQFLGRKFGDTGALERVDVLADRFGWPEGPQEDGWTLKYEMLAIADASGGLAAVRDHTAAVPAALIAGERPQAIVHLSHVLVAPGWRRSGLGGWLRALPLQVGRNCLRSRGLRELEGASVTLVAEMEAAPSDPAAMPASLMAYEKAGFRKLDPSQVPYAQPDFRASEEIDVDGGPRPLPFSLVIRPVGREEETSISGTEARLLARTLYRIYQAGCRPRDLAPLLDQVEKEYPAPGERVRLVPPTAAA
jgi:GNAT superfamily N-acetyltransferase